MKYFNATKVALHLWVEHSNNYSSNPEIGNHQSVVGDYAYHLDLFLFLNCISAFPHSASAESHSHSDFCVGCFTFATNHLFSPQNISRMSLADTVNSAIKEAMLAKQEGRLRGLRAIKSAILLAQTEKGASEALSAEKEIQVLRRRRRRRRSSSKRKKKRRRRKLRRPESSNLLEGYVYLHDGFTLC